MKYLLDFTKTYSKHFKLEKKNQQNRVRIGKNTLKIRCQIVFRKNFTTLTRSKPANKFPFNYFNYFLIKN